MAFVNEQISEADWVKFGLQQIDDNFMGIGILHNHKWTIDRERNIYLRRIAEDLEDFARIFTWTFHWQKDLVWFEDEVIDYRYISPCLMHDRLYNFSIPESIIEYKEQIFDDLRSAFFTYSRGGGLPKSCTEITLQLDFED